MILYVNKDLTTGHLRPFHDSILKDLPGSLIP